MNSKINISVSSQKLSLFQEGELVSSYKVSTALKGVGQEKNTNKTPLGNHIIRAMIGRNLPIYAVIKARRYTNEIWTKELDDPSITVDWILSRVIWLSGKDLGRNRLGNVDTMQRYIYIHGTNEEHLLGTPSSHGCIRMSNEDVIELFDLVSVGDIVEIDF
ncbi:ErfK/YbiS/YcfS/YnhG [Methylophilales bacterium HTCC2181]|uniref:ErfK/YbiS/YcfS/YnhG n=1 Tax=Methylophilales bacterium HTCC2181 TaxID=383631 RepID=A0P7L5_9PROT|nr:ErfK/YbiS/YcfS/YnhG [Methylophilales bacterium HTCC2181]